MEQATEVSFLNDECQQVFIIIELELEKPLNEEVYEDSHVKLLPDELQMTSIETSIVPDIISSATLESFRKCLHSVTKSIFNIYGSETDVNKIVTKMITEGDFSTVEGQLLDELKLNLSSDVNFEEFKPDFMCQLTSKMLNKTNVQSETELLMMAKVFDFMGMKKQSDEIFLLRIHKSQCEQNWIDYAVHSLRKEKFSKAFACTEKAISYDPLSIIAHILQAYICFKLQRYSESERLINFMQFKHGSSMEFLMILHLINVKKGVKSDLTLKDCSNVHEQMQRIYDSREVLWFATPDTKNFLSWQDPFIKSAVFFAKLGCLDFSELALSEYYSRRGVNINYSYLLAVIDAIKGDYSNSRIHLNKIFKEDIGNHQVNYQRIAMLMSLVLVKMGKFERAEELHLRAKQMSNTGLESFLINFTLGAFYNESGDPKKSIELLSSAHNLFPSHLTFLELGKSYQSLNLISSAELCFHQTVNSDNQSSEAWNNLYNIYMKQSRMELAALSLKNRNDIHQQSQFFLN